MALQSLDSLRSKIIVMALVLSMISGCGATIERTAISKKVGTNPAIGVLSTAEVGEVVAEQFDYDAYLSAILSEPLATKLALGRVDVPAGIRLEGYTDTDGNNAYCSTEKYYYDPLTGPYGVVCFLDSDNDQKFDKFQSREIGLGGYKDIDQPVSYQAMVADVPIDSGSGYKLQLIYQGLDEGDIKIAYREYVNNMARPAFSQIVTYPYQGDEVEIAFKGARITVHSITANEIRYTMTRGFTR